MPGTTKRAGDLLLQFGSQGRAAAISDNLRFEVIQMYKDIRSRGWTWNYRKEGRVTIAPIEEAAGILHSWTEGGTVVSNTIVSTVSSQAVTGCFVLLGEEWYKVIDYNYSSANAFIVDRPIKGRGEDVRLQFCRSQYGFRGGKTRNVKIDQYKAFAYEEGHLASQLYVRRALNPSFSRTYTLEEAQENLPPAPKYPPVVTAVNAGAFPRGKYYYFYTRYDHVAHLESAPGPIALYESNGTLENPFITYGLTDDSDYTSYNLRLYRTQVNPDSSINPPFFLINERGPRAPVSTFQDPFVTTLREEQFYDGKQQVLTLLPPPDGVQSIVVDLIDTYGFRFWEDENIPVGDTSAVTEILALTAAAAIQAASGQGAVDQLVTMQKIRGQIDYHVNLNRCDSNMDYSLENYSSNLPGHMASWPTDVTTVLQSLPWAKDWP